MSAAQLRVDGGGARGGGPPNAIATRHAPTLPALTPAGPHRVSFLQSRLQAI